MEAGMIVNREIKGNQVYYQANSQCPAFNELKSLADKGVLSAPERCRNGGNPKIKMPRIRIAGFCRRHHIKKLSLFGSVLTSAFKSDSDIDVLVEFESGYTPGWDIVSMENELSSILGRKVDLHTKMILAGIFSDRVVREAQVQYAAKSASRAYIRHMLDFSRQAVDFTSKCRRSALDSNTMLALAVTRLIELIGGIPQSVPDLRKRYQQIPWAQIVGNRDRLAHGYIDVDYEIIWRIVTDNLPSLIKQLEQILSKEEDSSS